MWGEEKDYWNSNLFRRLVDFLDVETMEEEKKCVCCRNVKTDFDHKLHPLTAGM